MGVSHEGNPVAGNQPNGHRIRACDSKHRTPPRPVNSAIKPERTTPPGSLAAGYLLLFLGMALVGVYVALSKPLTAAIPVFLLAWLRFAIAAVFMMPWLRPRVGDQPLRREQFGTLFVCSLFGNFLFSICMLYGVSMTSATASGVILSSMPAIVALMSWLMLRERLSPRTWLAVGFAVAGVALLTLGHRVDAGASGNPRTTDLFWLGNGLVFASVFCESIYVILGKRLTATMSPQRISAAINLTGLLLMTPPGLWQAAHFDFRTVDAGIWAMLVFYSLAASMWSTWLWLSGLKRVPASRSGVFTIAMPLSATAIGIAFLGEALSPLHVVAFGLAALGVVLVTAE